MKQRAKWQMLIVLFVLCVCMLLGVFSLNNGFFSTNVFADESTSSSIEEYLTFSLFNNGTEYKVTARNKSITEIKIPYKYNDIPVTEISDNAFMGCSNLKEIWIPYTVKRIGNNAFANCRNLEIVNGMSRVENIGNNAFALCPKLNNLILPNTINSLGSTILRNNTNTIYSRKAEAEMTALNSSWKSSSTAIIIYGNELVLDEVYAEDGITVAGYRIEMVQNLNEEVDFVLGDTYNGLPLLEINEWAFSGNRFSSFTLKHGEIVPDSEDVGTQHLLNDNDSSCNHVVNIQSGVFLGANIPYIDLLVDVSFNNVGLENFGFLDFEKDLSSDIFAGSTELIRVTLPDNITYIPRSAFNGCSNLREIVSTNLNIDVNHLSDNITKIGTEAFSGCYSLINLYIPQSITTMGNAVFNQWGDSLNSIVNQTIYLDFYEPPVGKTGYNWDQDWLGTIYEKANVQFKTIQITFDKDGGKADVGTNEVQAMLNQDMPEALAPERNHYTFKGYYSERNGNGTKYYDENMNSVTAWDKQTSTILYAYWIPDTYTVTFDKQGGTGGSNSVIASYEQAMPTATAPEKTGYRFLGYYYANPTGTDIQYYDGNMVSVKSWNISRNTTLYAKWDANKYTVILNQDGGIDGQNYCKVKYDEEMPEIQEPHKTGYTFSGYYTEQNGQGTKYYNADMTSAKNWDIDQDNISLYAYWTPTSYTITFDKQGGIGGTDEVDSVYYQGDLPEGLVAPTREGYIFKGFYKSPNGIGKQYYGSEMNAMFYLDVAENITLYAYWDTIVYEITYQIDDYKGFPEDFENPNPITYTVEDSFEFISVEANGYRVVWTPSQIENSIGNITISGVVEPIEYIITYDLNGGNDNGDNPSTYTVESNIELKPAVHNTLHFIGWSYNGTIIENLNGLMGNITLIAMWTDTLTISISSEFDTMIISDRKVIISMNQYFDSHCHIIVASECESLTINGNGYIYSMTIETELRSTDFELSLCNIGLTGWTGKDTINIVTDNSSATLYLYAYQTVVIKAQNSKRTLNDDIPLITNPVYPNNDYVIMDGNAAINCSRLVIQYADNLTIQGGDGSEDNSFFSGNSGGNGGPGVIVESELIINCDNVTIAGGSAGNGANGNDFGIYIIYRGLGGKGSYPIVGKDSEITVYILETAENIQLYKSSDGRDGSGPVPEGGIIPTNPNPTIPDIDFPIIDDSLTLPPWWGGEIIPPPTDPVIPPIIGT